MFLGHRPDGAERNRHHGVGGVVDDSFLEGGERNRT